MRKGLKRGDDVVVSGIPCKVGGINTDGHDKEFLARHTFVRMDGLNGSGWIPDDFVMEVQGKPESIHNLLSRSRTLLDTARERLRPLVDAIGEYLCLPRDTALGIHWLGEGHRIKCYRGSGAGVHLEYSPILSWVKEDAIHFYITIDYYNDEHTADSNEYDPLKRTIEVRAPLSLAEDFTKKGFDAWVKKTEADLASKAIALAQEKLDKAKKLQRA